MCTLWRSALGRPVWSVRFPPMVAAYTSSLLIVLAALLLGRGICLLSGSKASPWLAAPVGLAALLVICDVGIRLPGRAWTAVVIVVALCASSAVLTARHGRSRTVMIDALPVLGILLVLVSLPFAANGRFGVLGVSYDNDMHWHLLFAQALREPGIRHVDLDTYGAGYPLGPHAVAATFAQMIGTGVDRSFMGLLMATPLLTGLAALGALRDLSSSRRWLVAVLAGIPYMLAAAYAESSFKEPILALLLLGMVLAVTGRSASREAAAWERAIPIAVLLAGVIYDYSYPGLFWVAACGACWLVAEVLLSGAWRHPRGFPTPLRAAVPSVVVVVVGFVVLIAPELGNLYTFWTSTGGSSVGSAGGVQALGNLAGPLSSFEGLNLWPTGDFRFVPSNVLQSGVLAGFGLVVLGFGLVAAVERRDAPWLGGMVGLILAYAYVKHSLSPYVASKALMLPGPLLMIGGAGELARRLEGRVLRAAASAGFAVALLVFAFFALQSSALALRDALVGPQNHTNELRAIRRVLHGRPTLVLFYDDYFKWELLGVPVSSVGFPSPIPVSAQAAKPWTYGQALDFDSVSAATLNQFDYVVTTRTEDQSEPPPNFRLVATSPSYEVFQRVGPTVPRRVLAEAGQPGARLDCRTGVGRRLATSRGVAAIRDAPRVTAMATLVPGASEDVVLRLPAGRWSLSLPFTSPQAIVVRGPGLDVTLPPNLDRPGSVWPVGNMFSTGTPITLKFAMQHSGLLSSASPITQYFTPQALVATRPAADQIVPPREACGRYVDWYRLK